MSSIKTFPFHKDSFSEIRKYHFGYNWPVVYVLEDGKEIYIGETTSLYNRSKQHDENPERTKLKNIHIITDEEYNKSAALDIESLLIQYIVADEKFIVQNGNSGLSGHNYYEKEKYEAKFEKIIWEELRKMKLVDHELIQLKNSEIFKYSPYKNLTGEQLEVVEKMKDILQKENQATVVVSGGPGTGKTILATYLVKNLLEQDDFKHLKIGFVVPMTSLRMSIKSVFRRIKGLNAGMVIGPADVVKDDYDLLIVDEAHRLKQRKNITNFASYDQVNRKLGFDKNATELDWILARSKYQIFFYDKNQSVRPADIHESAFAKMHSIKLNLKQQMRVKGGDKYIKFIETIFDLEPSECNFEDYDFKLFDNIHEMVKAIKEKNNQYDLSRIVAGYAWPWKTKNGEEKYDIEIDGLKLVWNSINSNWVNSPNSINEVGCIHTVQGYDLNYVGLIIGPEISYDPEKHKIIIDESKYKDINGKRSISDPKELEGYIVNIYKTLLTRGIYGTYVYIVDKNLRDYFHSAVEDTNFT